MTTIQSLALTANMRLNVVLQRTPLLSLSGTVTLNTDTRWPFASQVDVFTADSVNVGLGGQTTPNGQYTVTALAPGQYQVSVVTLGFMLITTTVTVPTSAPLNFQPQPTTGCAVMFDLTDQIAHQIASVPSSGAALTLSAYTNHSGCAWTATSQASWIAVSTTAGTQSADISVNVTPNTTGVSRQSSVYVSPCPADSGFGFCSGDETYIIQQGP